MINKLTKKQEAKMPEYVKKFLSLGLSTKQFTAELKLEIVQNFAEIYKTANFSAPEVIFCQSPIDCLAQFRKISGKTSNQEMKDQVSNFCWGSQSAGWIAFYSFMKDEVNVSNIERIQPLIDLVGKCSFYLPYENVVFVSANLTSIQMQNGRLHNTKGFAWEYADGFGGYSLDGIAVTKEIIDAITGSAPVESVLNISNAEQRLVAIKYAGPERLLSHLNSRVLSVKGDYKLHSFQLEGEQCIMLEMQNPSEPKKHYEFVPPEANTVDKALAWRVGLDTFVSPVAHT